MPQNSEDFLSGCLPADYLPRGVQPSVTPVPVTPVPAAPVPAAPGAAAPVPAAPVPAAPGAVTPCPATPGGTRPDGLPVPPKSLAEWLVSTQKPNMDEIAEALAKAMAETDSDEWNIGIAVMPTEIPAEVFAWLGHAPAWPVFRPAREAWLTACMFGLTRDAGAWCQRGELIEDDWARESVARLLRIAGLITPASPKDGAKLVDETYKELQRLPWPGNRLGASEDPLAGWVRGALEISPSGYVATTEIYAVWQYQNPGDPATLKEFGERLAKVLLTWQKAGAESGLVAPVKNISRSCCRDYPRNIRPRGWGGLTLREGAVQVWKNLSRCSPASCPEGDAERATSSP